MKARSYLFTSIFIFVGGFTAIAQISGIVFRDYNGNGIRDNTSTFAEPLLEGIKVTAFPATGSPATTLSDVSGAYSFTGLTLPIRIEFSDFEYGDYATFKGSESNTSVQFYHAAASDANFGVFYPFDYCQINPPILVSCYEPGNAVYSPNGNTNYALVSVPYNSSGAAPGTITKIARFKEVGAVWGMAYQKSTSRSFSTAILKRHMGLGPLGLGGIYVVDFSSGSGTYTTAFDLQGINPSNGGPTIDFGSVDRSTVSSPPFDYILPNDNTTNSRDIDAFGKVGKVGYGATDISQENATLWTVNLFQNALISVDISDPNNYPGTVKQYLLNDFTGLPTCTNGQLRPWAIKIRKNKGYIGCVCTGENGGTTSDLRAYVLSFDPSNPVSFINEIDFPLNYNRENGVDFPSFGLIQSGQWRTWKDTWASTGLGTTPPSEIVHAQPILSNIEFDDNDNMILSLMDRFGHQMSYKLPLPLPGNTRLTSGDAAGDLLRVCRVGSNWVMEGGVGCPVSDATGLSSLTNDGPSGSGEFFYTDHFDDSSQNPKWNHNETHVGANKILRGSREVTAIHYDPIDGGNLAFDLGFLWYQANNGSRTDQYRLIESGPSSSKGNGIGDFQYVCNPAPIQIGNRVWADTNGDGIQDPAETPLSDVTIQLIKDANVIATAVTDAHGNYYFSSATGTNTASAIYGITQLMPNMQYTIRIPNVQGGSKQSALGTNVLTVANAGGGIPGTQADVRDSDGLILGDHAEVMILTSELPTVGANNHNFDFGFRPMAACPPLQCVPVTVTKN